MLAEAIKFETTDEEDDALFEAERALGTLRSETPEEKRRRIGREASQRRWERIDDGRCAAIQGFVAERCLLIDSAETLPHDLHDAFIEWATKNQAATMGYQVFGELLVGRSGAVQQGTVWQYRATWPNPGDPSKPLRPMVWKGIKLKGELTEDGY